MISGIDRGQSPVLDESEILCMKRRDTRKIMMELLKVSTMTKATLANQQGPIAAKRT